MPDSPLSLEHVWAHYGGTPVLEDVSLSLQENDFLGIIGPNGGGKTTLLRLILGLIKPTRGALSVVGMTPRKARRYVGYVPQYLSFDRAFPITVTDLVLMGRLAHTKPFRRYAADDRQAVDEALRTVDMRAYRDAPIGELSGGQRQRVLIARALVTDPKLLLLDEPAANIDPSMAESLYALLAALKKRMTIIMVSHDIGAVSVHVDKIACLNKKLYYHNSKEMPAADIEATYQCPIQLIAHGVPHRVLCDHDAGESP